MDFYDKYEEQDKRLETIVRYYTDTDGNKVDYRQVDHPKATGAAPMKYSEDPEQKGERQSMILLCSAMRTFYWQKLKL